VTDREPAESPCSSRGEDRTRVALCDAVVDWAIRCAEGAAERRDFERAVRWALVAARTASNFGGGRLVIPRIEHLLGRIGRSLPSLDGDVPSADPRVHWVHVMSEAHSVGGHTALVRRWIELDPADATHDVVLTFQTQCVVPSLADAVAARGGRVIPLGHVDSLVDRASQLRGLLTHAHVVVFHTHQWDVVATAACAHADGPPVLILNHADHEFWVGASVADALIHIRPSGREYAARHRGGRRHLYLPVPIPEPAARNNDPIEARAAARAALGVPLDAAVALTIGTPFKYTPVCDADFWACARQILERVQNGIIMAVGPYPHDPAIVRCASLTGGRLLAFGIRADLPLFHEAADLYLEGFPFGSLTAMLEAAAAGLAVVRAPAPCPPPFTSDGEALQGLPQPADFAAYVATSAKLLSDQTARRAEALDISAAVRRVHLGPAWAAALTALQHAVPRGGDSGEWAPPAPVRHAHAERWAQFRALVSGSEPVAFAKEAATELDLAMTGDWSLAVAILAARRHARAYGARRVEWIPLWRARPRRLASG